MNNSISVALCGLPGVGKSSVGNIILAKYAFRTGIERTTRDISTRSITYPSLNHITVIDMPGISYEHENNNYTNIKIIRTMLNNTLNS